MKLPAEGDLATGGIDLPRLLVVEDDIAVFERPRELAEEFWRELCIILAVETIRFVMPIFSMCSQASVRLFS